MIFLNGGSSTPVVVANVNSYGPDYIVHTTTDVAIVVCHIHSMSGRLHFSTVGNFCLSQDFIDEMVRQVGDL